MKRVFGTVLIIMAAMMSASCVAEISDISENACEKIDMTFTASFADTRTTLVDGVNVWWKPGDQISVNGDPFWSQLDGISPTASFYGSTPSADAYYAVYPYLAVKSWNGNSAVVFVPMSTTTGNTIEDGWNISAAMSSGIDGNMVFRNLLAYVKFTVTDKSWKINKVSVSSNDGSLLSGECVIRWNDGNPAIEPVADGLVSNDVEVIADDENGLPPGDYYIGLVPGTHSSGLSFSFRSVDGKVDVKTIGEKVTLKSGVIQNIGKIEGLEDIRVRERKALVEFYEAAGGDNWDNNTNWCSDAPVSEWYGVGTNGEGLVISLDMMNNGIVCEDVPESLADLKFLRSLWLRTTSDEIPYNVLKLKGLTWLEWSMDGYAGALPKEISQLNDLTHLMMSGSFTSIPDEIADLDKLEHLLITGPWYGGGNIPGGIPHAVSRLKNLKYFGMSYFDLQTEIPDWIYDMTSLESLYLNNLNLTGCLSEDLSDLKLLENLSFGSNKLEGNLPAALTSLLNLRTLYLNDNNFTGNIPSGFSDLTKLIEIWIYGNRLSGIIPEDFEENPNFESWGAEQNVLLQQSGYILSLPSDVYVSTDYSKDGEVVVLQKASKGSGVDVVLLGDGFVDKDMDKDGKFEQAMNEAMGYMFSLEPMKTYKDYFNVYAVRAVSKNDRFGAGFETALECFFDAPPSVSGNGDKCMEYAAKAPVRSLEDLTVAVVLNSNTYAGTTYWVEGNVGIAFIGMSRPVDGFYEKTFESTFIHEVVGHAFGKLADEYVYKNETHPESGNLTMHEAWIESGYYANIDLISDPEQIRWSHMLKDERYSSYTGIVEGGELFAYGVWRPEERSMMRNNDPYFNAPSREAIVKRIMKLAGEDFLFEDFAEKDVYSPLPYTRANYVEKAFEPTAPPVFVKSWSDLK